MGASLAHSLRISFFWAEGRGFAYIGSGEGGGEAVETTAKYVAFFAELLYHAPHH